MALFGLSVFFLLCLSAWAAPGNGTEEAGGLFRRFLARYGRRYSLGSLELQRRERFFQESIQRHVYLNSPVLSHENNSAIYGINQFSDLSPEEFKAIYLQSKAVKLPEYVKTSTKEAVLPARFDWRDKKFVTPVRNQLSCGGCWAFSIVGGIESAYAIKGNLLEELSVQQVIDCSYEDHGCNGGSTISALHWLNKTRVKLARASEYKFKAQTGICHYFPSSDFGVSIRDYKAYNFRPVSLTLVAGKVMETLLNENIVNFRIRCITRFEVT
ncbi:cathepsin O isoform X2 [Microcaecilia unicolor]|uniref:Cathepsin O isoform X2 n=1 Tax=Microcaecilia unicolor TaxID=1415580 RepID=A0A6P7XA72_9AMPH|nr:cathepsin O isoform X2 [Microcaecilia unicolor]